MNPNIRMIATIATGRELRIALNTYDATGAELDAKSVAAVGGHASAESRSLWRPSLRMNSLVNLDF